MLHFYVCQSEPYFAEVKFILLTYSAYVNFLIMKSTQFTISMIREKKGLINNFLDQLVECSIVDND
jgi:hypothetical protein